MWVVAGMEGVAISTHGHRFLAGPSLGGAAARVQQCISPSEKSADKQRCRAKSKVSSRSHLHSYAPSNRDHHLHVARLGLWRHLRDAADCVW